MSLQLAIKHCTSFPEAAVSASNHFRNSPAIGFSSRIPGLWASASLLPVQHLVECCRSYAIAWHMTICDYYWLLHVQFFKRQITIATTRNIPGSLKLKHITTSTYEIEEWSFLGGPIVSRCLARFNTSKNLTRSILITPLRSPALRLITMILCQHLAYSSWLGHLLTNMSSSRLSLRSGKIARNTQTQLVYSFSDDGDDTQKNSSRHTKSQLVMHLKVIFFEGMLRINVWPILTNSSSLIS